MKPELVRLCLQTIDFFSVCVYRHTCVCVQAHAHVCVGWRGLFLTQ